MTSSNDTLAVRQEAAPSEAPGQTPDWRGVYDAMLTQLMANVETMVAHAFAAQAKEHGLPIPPETPKQAAPAPQPAPEAPRAAAPPVTGNAGLDFLNEHLHKSAPTILPPTAMPTPPWLHPFTLPEKVRFTRTPDPIMRWERAKPTAEELAAKAREAARLAADEMARARQEEAERARAASGETTPIWRKPFTLPPNVRYTRTPDPIAPRAEPSAAEDVLDRVPTPAEMGAPQNVATTTTDVQETVSTSESPDGAYRAVTVTKTVTTVESVTVSTVEPTLPWEQPEVPATGAFTPSEASAVPLLAPEIANDAGTPAMAETALAGPGAEMSFDASLPAWFGIFRQSPGIALLTAAEQDNGAQTPVPAAPTVAAAIVVASEPDADSEGSAALFRDRFLPDMTEPVTPAQPAPAPVTFAAAFVMPMTLSYAAAPMNFIPSSAPAPETPPSEPVVNEDPAPASTVINLRTLPERRAFGSHGIPAFEQAVHFESDPDFYQHPPIELLAMPQQQEGLGLTREALEQNARLLEGVLEDFGIRGEIIAVRPGPVVTLYELEPAPGVKSSRVMGLADDIARSMSAISARVAVVQGRNVIGIELPNERRETVFLRELVASDDFDESGHKLAIALGKTIGGESVIVDLARMPHLLVAGTTGSGKSVAINTMILSLLYRLKPEECRLIMVDPKMLELSIYDGIPHLLTPVVTDSKKAVIALKWAVREMEDRYKKMAKVGVRNIDGFNARVTEAKAKGEVITRTVQMGFDRETGDPVFETEQMDLSQLPYIVIIVDEMADLMMVAGKEIEGAIQRLAQMARAAGIHLIMATQRPSVDVITGTIKANFPTRISFQVTSKIDSRTILGEQGAEQLLGQGDMLHMAGGGRIVRVHGPFVSDGEVEKVVLHLKSQGRPEYLDIVTADDEEATSAGAVDDDAGDGVVFDKGAFGGEDSADLYEQAVKVVLRDKKCSTSYIQRRLQVGYNKAASLVERMEKEGLVGAANHAGKREILNFNRDHGRVIVMPGDTD